MNNIPKLGTNSSATSSPTPVKIRSRPIPLNGMIWSARPASTRQIAPATPGKTTPGCVNSTYSPSSPAKIRSSAICGSEIMFRKRLTRLISSRTTCADLVRNTTSWRPTCTLLPSIFSSSSSRSSATRSITFFSSASFDVIALESRTASIAHLTLRLRSCAIDSMNAAAKFSIFSAEWSRAPSDLGSSRFSPGSGGGDPPGNSDTGCAAPILVPGAIAAT